MTQIPNGKTEADQNLVLAKRQFEKMMFQFHKVLEDKTLLENRTQGQQNVENDVVLRLIESADKLDALNAAGPEGTLGLITALIHIGLLMRDQNNRLRYDWAQMDQRIKKLEKQRADVNNSGQRGV